MRKALPLGVLIALVLVHDARATRNTSGTYALPAGNPAIPSTLITASQWNSNFNDLGNELTDSLSRSGKGGMLAPVRGVDGSQALPAYSFVSDNATGFFLKSAANACLSVTNVEVSCHTATTSTFDLPTTFGSTLAVNAMTTLKGNGAAQAPVLLTPQVDPTPLVNGMLWIDTATNRLSAQVNGSTQRISFSGSIVRTDLPAVGQQVSTTSGTSAYSGAKTNAAVTGSVSVTSGGRPIFCMMQPDGTNPAWAGVQGAQVISLNLARGGSVIATWQFSNTGTGGFPYQLPASPMYLDVIGAGTYSYQVTITQTAGISNINSYKLVCYEL